MAVRFGVYPEFWRLSRLASASNLPYTTSTLKCAFLTNNHTVDVTHANWTDVSAYEVATGSTYSAGGVEVTGKFITLIGGDPRQTDIESNSVYVATDATGFTNAYYAVLYFSTSGQLYAVGNLGSVYSIQGGNALYINISAADVYINRYTLSPSRTVFT